MYATKFSLVRQSAVRTVNWCSRLRPHAQDLVDAFGFAPEHVRAPIASGIERQRQDEARAHYADLAARGEAPVPEKSLKKK